MHADQSNDSANKWLILFVVIIGTFMAMLDSSIINIAIAKMMAVFGSSLETIQWVLTAYTLTMGTIVPLTAYLMDIWGNKKVFIFALVTFTLGSFLCGLAWSDSAMIAFRVVQAIGGGMIVPVGMTMIMQLFPAHERGMALGIWGIAAWAAPAVGPTLGGYIIQDLDWRLIFYLNIPIGVLGIILAQILLKSTPRKALSRFDYIGFITSTVGIVSILYVLGEGAAIDWANIKNPLLLTLGGFSLLMFVINELHHPDPLLDLRLLKNLDFSISQITQCILVLSLMGGMYLVPLFLQNFRGYTAMQTGIIMLPSAIATGLSMPISGKLFDKFGIKPVVIPGMLVLFASSCALAFINMDTSRLQIIMLLTIRGLAMGFVVMPVTTAGMNAIPTILAGKASTINNIIKQLAGSLGVTVMTTLLQHRLNVNYGILSEQITSFNPVATNLLGQYQGLLIQNGYAQNDAYAVTLYSVYELVQKQAYVDAVDYTIMITALAVLAALAMVWLIRGDKPAEIKAEAYN